MTNVELGWPYPKRVKHLHDVSAKRSEKTHGVRFQGKLQHMPIYSVPLDLPKYRLENGRTAAAQIEYLAKNPKIEKDIFTKDPESTKAQALQHQLLKGMVNESGLFDYFKKHEQEIPLILSSLGFVVNGNRRLCAMRELFSTEDQRFKYVDVVLLPPCDDREIDWLEGKEQIHRDITARYSWTATAIMYRRRIEEHKFKPKDLATLYEVNEPEVTELLDLLSHGDLYLADRGKTGQYSELDEDEFAFRQLKKNRSKLKSEDDKEIYDQICYTLIDKSIGDRSYQAVADVAKFFDRIVEEIQTDIVGSAGKQTSQKTLLGTATSGPSPLLKTLSDSTKHDQVREIVREVIDSERAKARDLKKANYVLSQTKKASGALQDAASALSRTSSKVGVAGHLDTIESSLRKIRKWLNG